MEHLAIMDDKTIHMILDGKKLIESRFSINNIIPFNNIKEGDIVYLKVAGGLVKAMFVAGKITFFKDLNCKKIQEIKNKYNNLINADDEFWKIKENSHYGTLIEIKNPRSIVPFSINKTNRQAYISFNASIKGYLKQK